VGVNDLKNVLVTGGAGFIGSNLVKELLKRNHKVTVVDNLSTGDLKNLKNLEISFVKGDVLDDGLKLTHLFRGMDEVYHLAANADVRDGWKHPRTDFEQNTLATVKVLEACAESGVPHLVFSSTGSVYGEALEIPTSEKALPPGQTSLYGASKFAAEGFIQAYAEANKLTATILRFVSVLGPNYSHGHVIDFVRKLLRDPTLLEVLGNGAQKKSYMHVSDCVRGVIDVRGTGKCEVFNLGFNGYCEINDSIKWITETLGVSPSLSYSGGDRGWVGDNPFIWLDTAKASQHGWEPKFTIQESIIETTSWLRQNLVSK